MSHLFAAILLLSSPGCPHEEPTCITPTEYVEVDLSTGRIRHALTIAKKDEHLANRLVSALVFAWDDAPIATQGRLCAMLRS